MGWTKQLTRRRKNVEPLPDKIQDAISDKYDDAANWASENPELATALGVGIPGALLAGAGALALRRRQRNVKDK